MIKKKMNLAFLIGLPFIASCSSIKSTGDLGWAIHQVQAPWQAMAFRDKNLKYIPDKYNYGIENHWATAKEVIEKRGGDSTDICSLMEHLLYDKNYHPQLLYLRRKIISGENLTIQEHDDEYVYRVVCTYKERGKMGCIGATSKEDVRASFNSKEEVIQALSTEEKRWEILSILK